MKDKVVLITGASGGIGKETARALGRRGAKLVLACRDQPKALLAAAEFEREGAAAVELVDLDLASLDSVRGCARQLLESHGRLDVQINNAGAFSLSRRESKDGFELTMAVNYFGPVLLTMLLLPLTTAGRARIVNVSSNGSRYGRLDLRDLDFTRGYQSFRAYAASKSALNLFTQELAERVKHTGVTVNAVHPGHVNTGIWPKDVWYMTLATWIMAPFQITAEEGAKASVHLASSPEVEAVTGQYFDRLKPRRPSSSRSSRALREELWRVTMERLALPAPAIPPGSAR